MFKGLLNSPQIIGYEWTSNIEIMIEDKGGWCVVVHLLLFQKYKKSRLNTTEQTGTPQMQLNVQRQAHGEKQYDKFDCIKCPMS